MRICMMSSGVVIMSSEKGFRSAAGKPRRFYVRHSRLSFGEDRTHEFKGHRSLACEEVPRRLMHSRKSVSRNINGFLNTGQGGKIYLGVLDDGVVAGLALSDSQKDHVRVSLEDLMGRYSPPVPPSRYRLSFVPVVGSTATEMARDGDSGVGLDGSEEESCASSPAGERMRGHLLRTARYCWCDRNTRDLMLQGVSIPYYVVEISVLPFVRDPTLPPMVLQLYPIYQSEQRRCYFRGSTSLHEYSYHQIAELTIAEVEEHFSKIKRRLREEVKEYMAKVTLALANLAKQQRESAIM